VIGVKNALLIDLSGRHCCLCGWLFVDRSRNGNRRWCDMRTCGSRDKMRRYYRSKRSTRDGER
jgi:predicted RNA-binding Zn ribbon-like protein